MQKYFQRRCYKENPEIKIDYQKIGINKMLKLMKNIKNIDIKKTKKIVTRLTVSSKTSKTRSLLYLQNMSSKPVST